MVECRGMVTTMVAIEAMCKAADVTCVLVERVSGGVLVVVVRGDLASVQHAVEVGGQAAAHYGQVRDTKVFPRPAEEFTSLLGGGPLTDPGPLTDAGPLTDVGLLTEVHRSNRADPMDGTDQLRDMDEVSSDRDGGPKQ